MDAIEALGLPESRWVDLGGPVHYREWPGPVEGPTFVLVHGLGGSLLNWAPVAPGLADWGRVVAVDLAGFGLTPLEGRSAGVTANRRLLRAFIQALELPPVILVGNSMGGMVSLLQAARAPETVRALVLVDAAFPRGSVRASQFSPRVAVLFAAYSVSLVGERVAKWRANRLGPEGLVTETLRLCAPHPELIDPTLVAALIEQARIRMEFDYATPAFLEAARAIFRANVIPTKYRSLVRSLRQPALVLHGDRDRLVPVGGAVEAARTHANWTLEILPGLGHIPQMEAPQLWLEKVEAWLPTILDALEQPAGPRMGQFTGHSPEKGTNLGD
jgi:pimeloyl-ACP methyl ester carboxylesterase